MPIFDNTALLVAVEEELADIDFTELFGVVVLTGVGKVNAAIQATDILNKGFTHIVNYGSACSAWADFQNQIIDVRKFVNYDMDVTPLGFDQYQTPFEPGKYIQIGNHDHFAMVCATTDKFVTEPSKEFACYDMESYAIAKAVQELNMSFRCVKYISDSGNPDDWKENCHKGARKFYDFIKDNYSE